MPYHVLQPPHRLWVSPSMLCATCVVLTGIVVACAAPTRDAPQSTERTSDTTFGPSTASGSDGTASTTDGGGVSAGTTGGADATTADGGAASSASGAATTGEASAETTGTAAGTQGGSTTGAGMGSTVTGGGAPSNSSGGTPLPFFEDFEDGLADGFIAGIDNEQQPLGAWMVVDGETKVYQQQTATSDPTWAVGGDYRWTDQLLSVRMNVVSGIEDLTGIIAVRFSSFDGYAFLEIKSNQIKLRLRNAGSTTDQVVYKFDADLTAGSWHTYGLGVSGSDYSVYFDDQVVGTAVNAELTAGGIALGVTDAVVEFDDLSVVVPE